MPAPTRRSRHLAVVLAALVAVAVGACSPPRGFSALPEPETVTTLPATTTSRPDLTGVALPTVRGTTTTTVELLSERGDASLVGRVDGPDGPVAGATVLVERMVGDGLAAVMVPTAADGTWNLSGILGGRYRVRAWRVPDLVLTRPSIFFLEAEQTRAVEQRVESVTRLRVDTVVAPDPPIVGSPANLKVRLADRAVEEDGVVRSRPLPGVEVTLRGSGSWQVQSRNPATTGDDGAATFTVVCGSEGSQPLGAMLNGRETVELRVPDCTTATTTTSTTATTADGANTSTTAGDD